MFKRFMYVALALAAFWVAWHANDIATFVSIVKAVGPGFGPS